MCVRRCCDAARCVSCQIVGVQVADMAGYVCVAENKVGTMEKLFSLTVQGETPPFLSS